jgi:hypothetical protein
MKKSTIVKFVLIVCVLVFAACKTSNPIAECTDYLNPECPNFSQDSVSAKQLREEIEQLQQDSLDAKQAYETARDGAAATSSQALIAGQMDYYNELGYQLVSYMDSVLFWKWWDQRRIDAGVTDNKLEKAQALVAACDNYINICNQLAARKEELDALLNKNTVAQVKKNARLRA